MLRVTERKLLFGDACTYSDIDDFLTSIFWHTVESWILRVLADNFWINQTCLDF